MRIGIGYDIHRLVEGRKLILGGVELKNSKGLLGHSDADVLIHGVMDALLGAAGLRDIGTYFPDTDDKFKNISSIILLKETLKLLEKNNFKIVNLDCVIVAEEPKINPFIDEMKKNLSDALKIKPEQIGIKATTNEGLGSIGEKKAIACQAVALLEAK